MKHLLVILFFVLSSAAMAKSVRLFSCKAELGLSSDSYSTKYFVLTVSYDSTMGAHFFDLEFSHNEDFPTYPVKSFSTTQGAVIKDRITNQTVKALFDFGEGTFLEMEMFPPRPEQLAEQNYTVRTQIHTNNINIPGPQKLFALCEIFNTSK